jgi:hypothetical protein
MIYARQEPTNLIVEVGRRAPFICLWYWASISYRHHRQCFASYADRLRAKLPARCCELISLHESFKGFILTTSNTTLDSGQLILRVAAMDSFPLLVVQGMSGYILKAHTHARSAGSRSLHPHLNRRVAMSNPGWLSFEWICSTPAAATPSG